MHKLRYHKEITQLLNFLMRPAKLHGRFKALSQSLSGYEALLHGLTAP
jgi:hypothetical protein